MNLVVRTEDGAVSLLVDEIGDVLEVNPSAFENIPANVASNVRDMIRGVYKLRDRLLFVLDAEKTVDISWTIPVLKTAGTTLETHS